MYFIPTNLYILNLCQESFFWHWEVAIHQVITAQSDENRSRLMYWDMLPMLPHNLLRKTSGEGNERMWEPENRKKKCKMLLSGCDRVVSTRKYSTTSAQDQATKNSSFCRRLLAWPLVGSSCSLVTSKPYAYVQS